MMKIKLSIRNIFIYLTLIPFLLPRGFLEYSNSYKLVSKLSLFFAIALFIFYMLFLIKHQDLDFNKEIKSVIYYHIFLLIITLINQFSISLGFQKIFANLILCLFCYIECKKNPKNFISCLKNILIIIFTLNIFIFNQGRFGDYFDALFKHLTFLGHVHISAQIGLVAYLVVFINRYYYHQHSFSNILLFIEASIMMYMSHTSTSQLTLLLVFVGIIFRYISNHKISFKIDARAIFFGYLLLNVLMFYIAYINNWAINLGPLSLNGRGFIWRSVFEVLLSKPVIGYGVKGVFFNVFWLSQDTGINYAHNQFLQVLLDGGIILMIIFSYMMLLYAESINRIKNKGVKAFINVCWVVILLVMLFESPMEYFYIFLALSIMAGISDIERKLEENFNDHQSLKE